MLVLAASWCYLITEIDSTIVPLHYDVSDGKLEQLGPSVLTIPEDWPGLDVDAVGRPKSKCTSNPLAVACDGSIISDRSLLRAVTGEAPRGLKGNLTAHLEVHPNGKFIYGSNRGHDSIVCFAIDQTTGGLSYVAHTASGGQSPRAFAIHPSGEWMLVANEASGNIVVFSVETASGLLTQTAEEEGEMPTAMCLVFAPREPAAAPAL